MLIQPVILSGGAGTRLWPLSREAYPKQFLPLAGEHTMLQETVRRLDRIDTEHPHEAISVYPPLVVCNEAHRFLVAEQLRVIDREPAGIMLEPEGRNTAPALTVAAMLATATRDVDPILIAMPADHVIERDLEFRRVVALGHELAAKGAVVTFGIVPKSPETGYGYIRRGEGRILGIPEAYVLDAFVEKPDQETADSYLATGDYFWNSGIFMMKASLWLSLIERFRPDIASACATAFHEGSRDGEFFRVAREAFHLCPSDSIDYAVMERLARESGEPKAPAVVLPLDASWSDVGAWAALWEVRDRDAEGNVTEGDTFVYDGRDNLVIAEHRMVAAVGVDNLIIVETPDAVLVSHKERSQDVKAVTQHLKQLGRREHEHHRCVHRPWGNYEPIDSGHRYQVKRLTINPGASLSLQMHHHRAEHWIVVKGTARVTRGDEVLLLSENESAYIPLGSRHRLENPGVIPLEIIEVQSGSYLGEDDIERFEDVYNRTSSD